MIQYSDGTTTVEVPVTVNVNPVNEYSPVFGTFTPVDVSEDTSIGTTVATLTATDEDGVESKDGILTYAIISG